ncbi:MAG TPA: hypothetical protein VNT01_17505 [Symbiobacteriaceae bacterium]|nr:hypothetical protein [Symbiobacteriaceae bacterium]
MSTHAIVIGASMAGLMAAKVLAGPFDRVTVIERDLLPAGPVLRKGAPQAAHAHTLLIRGKQILEGLFPGLTADLLEHGAVESDSAAQILWHQQGVFKGRSRSGLITTTMTRALLEWQVRAHLLQDPKVTLLDGHRVTGLIATDDRSRVTGIQLEPVDRSAPMQRLNADLVVDAGGRGTRAPQWLAELGYPRVPVTEIKTDIAYSSRHFIYHGPAPDWNICLLVQQAPGPRAGVLFRIEGDRWLLTMQTMLGDEPPTDEAGFMAFARSLPAPQIAQWLAQAEPVSEIVAHRTPSNLRRHYEQMARFPDGLVILGDASTSFNPRYGQGMTTAALGVEALSARLQTDDHRMPGFSGRYQAALAKAIALPWQASTGEDLAFPKVEGRRTPAVKVMNWYMRRLIRLTAVDHEALVSFLRVVHLLAPAGELFKPRLVWKVLTMRDSVES